MEFVKNVGPIGMIFIMFSLGLNLTAKDFLEVVKKPRNLIIADKGSKIEVIERHQSLKDHSVVTNSLTEIYAEKNAFVDYYKIQNDLNTSSLIDNTFISQERDSNVSVHIFFWR